mmetsp:Transcript_20066/g.42364  ORF Transcript_20066/g.42364 Transcript_20066/m.42364 type:complete len:200 (-) Transcript_20066:206-805(-)
MLVAFDTIDPKATKQLESEAANDTMFCERENEELYGLNGDMELMPHLVGLLRAARRLDVSPDKPSKRSARHGGSKVDLKDHRVVSREVGTSEGARGVHARAAERDFSDDDHGDSKCLVFAEDVASKSKEHVREGENELEESCLVRLAGRWRSNEPVQTLWGKHAQRGHSEGCTHKLCSDVEDGLDRAHPACCRDADRDG